MKTVTINIAIAIVLGAFIWSISPYYTGQAEPWDAESSYYAVALFVTGLLLGIFRPMRLWSHPVGIVLGQLLYQLVFLSIGPLLLIGIMFLLVFSLFSLAGAFVGKILRTKYDEMRLGVNSEEKNV